MEGNVTGTLKYVDNYTGFSNNIEEQKGNYIAIKVPEATKGKTVKCKISEEKSKGEVTLDNDGILIAKIWSKTQTITIEIDERSKTLNLNQVELKLESA